MDSPVRDQKKVRPKMIFGLGWCILQERISGSKLGKLFGAYPAIVV